VNITREFQCLSITLWTEVQKILRSSNLKKKREIVHKERKSNKVQKCIKILLFYIYMKLNMFRATHRPSSGVKNCTGSLWFLHTWKVAGRVVDGRCQAHNVPDNIHKLHVQQPSTYAKTRGCQCSFRPLMMGGVSPETCWASYKYGIIKFWYIVAPCWIFFLYELYYDARIHKRQGEVDLIVVPRKD